MSDTPRTDAKERESENCAPTTHAHYGWKFARQLERELAEANRLVAFWEKSSAEWKASRERLDAKLAAATNRAEKAEAERDAAVKDAERYRWLSEQSMIEDGEAEVLLLDLNDDGSSECYYKYHGIALDAAIDAAIAAKGER